MKELSIEEKAKRYDELLLKLQKAKVDDNVCDEMYYRVIDDIVPELKESEDEKMRKGIIRNLEYLMDRAEGFVKDELRERIAWLEKQGTQPRYNIGDILCDKLCTTLNKEAQPNMEIVDIKNGMYICDKGSFPVSQQDEYVLVDKKIDSKLNDDSVSNELRAASFAHAKKEILNHTFPNNEEFELVYTFEKGAKWDAAQKPTWSEKYIADVFEKVGLAKIVREQSNDNLTNALQDAMIELSKVTLQPNPTAWSEEDEEILRTIISDGIRGAEFDMLQIDWLKSIKNRYAWKPSDEQMKVLEAMLTVSPQSPTMTSTLIELYEDLKKLRVE